MDWGHHFGAPLLSPYEAEVALAARAWLPDYPMDNYAKAGGSYSNYATEEARAKCRDDCRCAHEDGENRGGEADEGKVLCTGGGGDGARPASPPPSPPSAQLPPSPPSAQLPPSPPSAQLLPSPIGRSIAEPKAGAGPPPLSGASTAATSRESDAATSAALPAVTATPEDRAAAVVETPVR